MDIVILLTSLRYCHRLPESDLSTRPVRIMRESTRTNADVFVKNTVRDNRNFSFFFFYFPKEVFKMAAQTTSFSWQYRILLKNSCRHFLKKRLLNPWCVKCFLFSCGLKVSVFVISLLNLFFFLLLFPLVQQIEKNEDGCFLSEWILQ